MSQISQPNFVQLTERDFNRINGKKKKFLHPIKIYSSLTNLTEQRKNYRSEGVPEDAVSPPISLSCWLLPLKLSTSTLFGERPGITLQGRSIAETNMVFVLFLISYLLEKKKKLCLSASLLL